MESIAIYRVVTITHKATDLKNLSDFGIAYDEQSELSTELNALRSAHDLGEIMYLSTCNRITYVFTSNSFRAANLDSFFRTLGASVDTSLVDYYEGVNAVQHLYEVAASINSLRVGEREILRQLREAFHQSIALKTSADHIRLLMRYVVEGTKQIYAQTNIGAKPVSVVSLAFQKLNEFCINPNPRMLIVGAGQTNQLVAKFLNKHAYKSMAVFNRTAAKAEQLANTLSGKGYALSDLEHYSAGFDVLFVCTSSNEPVINEAVYKQLLQGETDRKIIIDLSVPLDTAAAVVENNNVEYIEIEGLKEIAKENLACRKREISTVQALITEFIEDFQLVFKERQVTKAMNELPVHIKQVKQKAIDIVFKKEIEGLDNETQELMCRMLDYMEKKCVGIPMNIAKKVMNTSSSEV